MLKQMCSISTLSTACDKFAQFSSLGGSPTIQDINAACAQIENEPTCNTEMKNTPAMQDDGDFGDCDSFYDQLQRLRATAMKQRRQEGADASPVQKTTTTMTTTLVAQAQPASPSPYCGPLWLSQKFGRLCASATPMIGMRFGSTRW